MTRRAHQLTHQEGTSRAVAKTCRAKPANLRAHQIEEADTPPAKTMAFRSALWITAGVPAPGPSSRKSVPATSPGARYRDGQDLVAYSHSAKRGTAPSAEKRREQPRSHAKRGAIGKSRRCVTNLGGKPLERDTAGSQHQPPPMQASGQSRSWGGDAMAFKAARPSGRVAAFSTRGGNEAMPALTDRTLRTGKSEQSQSALCVDFTRIATPTASRLG